MPAHLERARNGCALHGALQTLGAINGVVPVVHSTAGCAMQQFLGGIAGEGGVPGLAGGVAPSASNVGEKHIVFGGGSRLREQLKNTVKTVRGDLYAVVSGCATEMVGDDIPAMTKEGREQGFPVIHATTPGFRGGPHLGYQLAVRALIEQLPLLPAPEVPAPANLVNIWGIVPRQDLFWQGHLRELGRLFAELGLVANTLFGPEAGIDAWRRLPRASLNLVLSPWGLEAAELLEQRYGTPWLELNGLPVGSQGTGRMLEQVAELLSVPQERVEGVRRREEAALTDALGRLAIHYYAAGFQREFALVGETAQVIGLVEFLVGTLGLLPRLVVVTDNPPEPLRAGIIELLNSRLDTYAAAVVFSEESGEIADLVRASGAELVLGSSLEQRAAATLGAPLLQVAFPVSGRLILDRGYAGYRGAVTLLEDLGGAILSHGGRG